MRASLRSGDKKSQVIANICWLLFDKTYSIAIGLVASIFVARYLGPDLQGVLTWGTSLYILFAVMGTMAIDEIMVCDLIREPDKENEIFGTTLVLRVTGAMLAIVGTFLVAAFMRPESQMARIVALIVSVAHLANAASIINKLNDAHIKSKFNVVAANISLTIIVAAKLLFVYYKFSIYWFAATNFALGVISLAIVSSIYLRRGGEIRKWKFSLDRARQLLSDVWPRFPTVFAATSQTHLGGLILASSLGDARLGQYSIALKFYTISMALPAIMCKSVAPILVEAHKSDENLFRKRLASAYAGIFLLYFGAAIVLVIAAIWGIPLLYGPAYTDAGNNLLLLLVPLVFYFLGQIRLWFIAINELFRYSMYLAFLQLGACYALSLTLVPTYGEIGAVIAMTASALILFIADGFYVKSKPNFDAIINGFAMAIRLRVK